jgi:hypothetical protein
MIMQDNNYWSSDSAFKIIYNATTYSSLPAFRTGTGQERLNGVDVGFNLDPQLESAGNGGTIGQPGALNTLTSYKLGRASPLVNKGLDLSSLFAVQIGTRDFYGTSLPQGGNYDIGADELEVDQGSLSQTLA